MVEPDRKCVLEWSKGVIIDVWKGNNKIVNIICNKNAPRKEIANINQKRDFIKIESETSIQRSVAVFIGVNLICLCLINTYTSTQYLNHLQYY